jgi:alpha-beta hydrolase superfamily lysophospholipase
MRTSINSASLQYEIIGSSGPWVALSPGGRRPMAAVKALAHHIAAGGYRVLIHDRRSCGASEVLLGGDAADSIGRAVNDFDFEAALTKLRAAAADKHFTTGEN